MCSLLAVYHYSRCRECIAFRGGAVIFAEHIRLLIEVFICGTLGVWMTEGSESLSEGHHRCMREGRKLRRSANPPLSFSVFHRRSLCIGSPQLWVAQLATHRRGTCETVFRCRGHRSCRASLLQRLRSFRAPWAFYLAFSAGASPSLGHGGVDTMNFGRGLGGSEAGISPAKDQDKENFGKVPVGVTSSAASHVLKTECECAQKAHAGMRCVCRG